MRTDFLLSHKFRSKTITIRPWHATIHITHNSTHLIFWEEGVNWLPLGNQFCPKRGRSVQWKAMLQVEGDYCLFDQLDFRSFFPVFHSVGGFGLYVRISAPVKWQMQTIRNGTLSSSSMETLMVLRSLWPYDRSYCWRMYWKVPRYMRWILRQECNAVCNVVYTTEPVFKKWITRNEYI